VPRRLGLLGKPALQQDPGRTCNPTEREAQAGPGFLVGLATPWVIHTGAVFS